MHVATLILNSPNRRETFSWVLFVPAPVASLTFYRLAIMFYPFVGFVFTMAIIASSYRARVNYATAQIVYYLDFCLLAKQVGRLPFEPWSWKVRFFVSATVHSFDKIFLYRYYVINFIGTIYYCRVSKDVMYFAGENRFICVCPNRGQSTRA